MMLSPMWIVFGPSAAGKGTIVEGILERNLQLSLARSCTTRGPGKGEDPIKYLAAYNRMLHEAFMRDVAAGKFLEWENVHGNLYGTPRSEVGPNKIFEVNFAGAMKIKERLPSVISIFILASCEALGQRSKDRDRETADEREIRLAAAVEEIRQAETFDYWFENWRLDLTVDAIHRLIQARRNAWPLPPDFGRNYRELRKVQSTFPTYA